MASVRPAPLMPVTMTSSGICCRSTDWSAVLPAVSSLIALSFRIRARAFALHGSLDRRVHRGRFDRRRALACGRADGLSGLAAHHALVFPLPIILLRARGTAPRPPRRGRRLRLLDLFRAWQLFRFLNDLNALQQRLLAHRPQCPSRRRGWRPSCPCRAARGGR